MMNTNFYLYLNWLFLDVAISPLVMPFAFHILYQVKLCNGKLVHIECCRKGFYSVGKQRIICHNLVDLLRQISRAFDNVSFFWLSSVMIYPFTGVVIFMLVNSVLNVMVDCILLSCLGLQ